MSPDKLFDLGGVRTYPLRRRANKVRLADSAQPPRDCCSFGQFLEGLPNALAAKTLLEVSRAIVDARDRKRSFALAIGAHVIKVGLNPVIIDLMHRGLVTSVAINGGGSIHDFELALIGESSEDVADGLTDGRFGMVEETGHLMNEALLDVLRQDGPDFTDGMGELLGRKLIALNCPYKAQSILVAGVELDIPVTVHVAIGTDTIHMHPTAHGAALGQASFNDFRRYVSALTSLGQGGVYLNIGSAVLLPEVFLKAIAVLRNSGFDTFNFVTVNMDMIQHYRPTENVVKRPTIGHGSGYSLLGHHELMVPLLAQAIVEEACRRVGGQDPR